MIGSKKSKISWIIKRIGIIMKIVIIIPGTLF